MIKIKSGASRFYISLLILVSFSCEDKTDLVSLDGNMVSITKNDSLNVIIELHENGIVKKMITKNKDNVQIISYFGNGLVQEFIPTLAGKKHGEYLLYDESGRIKKKVNYKAGSRHGDTFEFFYGKYFLSQRLYKNDDAIYSSVYKEGEKLFSSPIPVFKSEKIRNDNIYEAIITFPFPFIGSLDIYFQDSLDFKKEYLDKYNLKLTINNFNKKWEKFDMLLEYDPAENDSLIWTEQVYNRRIRIE